MSPSPVPDETAAADPGEESIEGWEAEAEFHAPADNRVADHDAIALQVAIASHRVTRERDEWETADISLPASTTEKATVAIPQSVYAVIANGLAAGWLTDEAVNTAWARAKPQHIRQLRQLLAAANVRIFPARPGTRSSASATRNRQVGISISAKRFSTVSAMRAPASWTQLRNTGWRLPGSDHSAPIERLEFSVRLLKPERAS
ncbi:hypothetical protein HED63_26405 [Ochrobactrum cytisi]|nr:hypothetical protein [Brucella cytisi]